MGTPRVSICLPTYNGERFIADAIRSILTQSFEGFELVIVDDRSDDSTGEIVRGFTDPRITVYQNETRLGIPGNWNHALELAKGEYVCIFHQDDLMLPENLERKVAVLAGDPAIGFVHSAVEPQVETTSPNFSTTWLEQSPADFIVDGHTYFRKLLLGNNCICAPTVLAPRERVLRLGSFNGGLHFACDYELWMKLCVDGRVAYLSTPLVAYRWHEANASHEFRFERGFAEIHLAARNALAFFREKTGRTEEADLLGQALGALEKARGWAAALERDRENRIRETEQHKRYLHDLESNLSFRILARLGLLPRRSPDAP